MDGNVLKYRAFVETSKTGSFTRAAEILGCSQSGISRMISDIERDWGVTLMERGRNGVMLTPEGRELLPYAEEICRVQDQMGNRIGELNGVRAGHIRIGTFSSVATHWLPNIIKSFRSDYPDVDYELLLGDYPEIEEWVRSGRVDFGFLGRKPDMDLESEHLCRDEMMAVVPVDHMLAKEDRIPIQDLSTEPFMLLQKGERAEISDIFGSRGLEANTVFTTWDDYAIMSMVESGLGVSILPSLILRRIPYRIAIRPLDPPEYREICLVMRSRDRLPVAAKRFLEYIEKRDRRPRPPDFYTRHCVAGRIACQ